MKFRVVLASSLTFVAELVNSPICLVHVLMALFMVMVNTEWHLSILLDFDIFRDFTPNMFPLRASFDVF